MYGLSPVPQLGDMGLIPAMTVKCAVALVKSIRAGESVSYGHTWTAQRDTNLALLPIGYADGVFRSLGGRLEVLINGRRRPGVGRICMDQFVVDLGPGQPDVAEGDEAILLGRAPRASPLRRNGPTCSAPSTTRWSPAPGGGSPEPIARPKPLSPDKARRRQRGRAWLAGGAGAPPSPPSSEPPPADR